MLHLLLACDSEAPATERRRGRDSEAMTDSADSASTVDGLLCGDDLALGAHEECDGADDATCPGACSRHCQCPSMPASGQASLYFVDVGQGDGALLVSPAGFTLLLDAGDEAQFGNVRRLLRDEGIAGLDYTLVSHQHADHMGAMDLALAEHPEVGVAFDGGGRADSDAFRDYRAAAGDRRRTVVAGDEIDVGAGMTVTVLHGDVGDRENENNNSVVVRVVHGEVSALVGGDCEFPTCERGFTVDPTDVYKVHHHGSSDSSSGWLLGQLTPSVAVISCGEGNDYGHPHASVLRALAEAGVEVWRTDLSGTVTVRSDGATYAVSGAR